MVSFDAGFASFLKHAGTFFNAIMATGNTPTLGHFVKGTRAFVRVKYVTVISHVADKNT